MAPLTQPIERVDRGETRARALTDARPRRQGGAA